MQLRKTSVTRELPIKLEAVKKALRVDHAFEDDVIERKFRAAVEFVEERTGRILRPTSFELRLCGWPAEETIALQPHPIRDVPGVTYLAEAAGPPLDVPPDDFDWRTLEEGGEVYFFTSWTFPALSANSREPVVVAFEAGYDSPPEAPGEPDGDDTEYVLPSRVEELLLLLTGHWFKNREATTSGDLADVPYSAGLLLKELRIFR